MKIRRKKANYLPRINGIAFTREADYSVSAEIDEKTAAVFLAHDGYEVAGDDNDAKDAASVRKERTKKDGKEAEKGKAAPEPAAVDSVPKPDRPDEF